MRHRVSAIGIAAVLAVGGCSQGAPSASPPTHTSTSIVIDGVAISLTVDRDTTVPGVPIEAIVVVENRSGRAVRWRAGGCNLVSAVTIGPAGVLPAPVQPRDRIATFVARVTDGAESPGPTRTLPSQSTVDRRACQIDRGFAELAPGGRLTERAVWPATTNAGAPIAPGPYRVTGSFPMLAPAGPLVPAEFRADRDLRSIDAELALDVTAGGPERLRAADGVTALLAGTPLGGWVRNGDVTAADASLRFADGAWELRVRLPTGQVAIGRVDGSGGGRPRLDIRP